MDASKLDFGALRTSDFPKVGVPTSKDICPPSYFGIFLAALNEAEARTIYALGNVNLVLLNRVTRKVMVCNDDATDYDWNLGGGKMRNNLIELELFRNDLDSTHGFKTYYYGTGKLKR